MDNKNYIKINIDKLTNLNQMSSKCFLVILQFIKYMDKDNIVMIPKYLKDKICVELDIKINTLEHVVTQLIKDNFLSRKAICVYEIDKEIFGKPCF